MSELERTPDDRLALQQNASTSLQGQLCLLRSHQAVQDRRINFALAREAEEADGRINERLVSAILSFLVLFFALDYFTAFVFVVVFLCGICLGDLEVFEFKIDLFSSPFFRKLNCVILKKVGKIGGDENQVKARVRHILSTIDKRLSFAIVEVRVRGTGPRPPIYEVVLEDQGSAEDMRKSFSRYTRKRSPVTRPPELDGVELYNSATPATRVRLSILRVSLFWFFVAIIFAVSLSLCELGCRFFAFYFGFSDFRDRVRAVVFWVLIFSDGGFLLWFFRLSPSGTSSSTPIVWSS